MYANPADSCVIEWGCAGRALEGPSGDLHVVCSFSGGALVALLDGLGHGPEAFEASAAAAPVLEARPGDPVISLIERCHDALHKTRGAVMSLASIDSRGSSMCWIGVGNVEAILLRAKRAPVRGAVRLEPRSGIVGFQLPPLHAETQTICPGDTLIMATDGVRSGFEDDAEIGRPPQEIAEGILRGHARDTDDARVVVARYRGAVP